MSLQAVLFDLDGTLHNKSATLRAVGAAQYEWAGLRALGITAAHWESEYLTLNNQLFEKAEVFARLRSTFGLPKSVAAALLEDYDNNLGKSAILYAGAVDLLGACGAKGLKLGIITNGRDAFQRSKINGMGIANLIDIVVTSGGIGIKKPDLRIFQACLSELGVGASNAAFVGDDFAADMEPAISLGMHAVWKSTFTSPEVAFCSDQLNEIRVHLLQEA